jgi:hypothetical protein
MVNITKVLDGSDLVFCEKEFEGFAHIHTCEYVIAVHESSGITLLD